MPYLTLPGQTRIWYAERPDSPTEMYAGGIGKAKRTFDVRWEDRVRFMTAVLGWSEPIYTDLGAFSYIRRQPPLAYPAIQIVKNSKIGWATEPSEFWLHAVSVDSVEPIGIDRSRLSDPPPSGSSQIVAETEDPDGLFRHDRARITVSFEALPYRVLADDQVPATIALTAAEYNMYRYVSRTIQPHAEHLTLNFGQLFWAADAPGGLANQPATNQVGKIIPSLELVFTWHQVPGFPEQAFNMIGRINSFAITDYAPGTLRSFTYAAGTLLFTGMELKTYRMSTGIYCNDVVYRMKYFSAIDPSTGNKYSPERGHNYFIAPGTTGISYAKLEDAAGRGVYQEADLRELFKLPNLV